MKKKNVRTLDLVRLVIQIIFLIIAPAPFSTAFAGLKGLAVKVGEGDSLAMSAMLKLCLALVVFTIVFGRFFCGWACAFGTYNDIVNRIARRLKIKQIKNEKLDKYLPKVKYGVLVLILGLCAAGLRSLTNGTSPWDVFAKILALNFHFSGYAIGVVLLLLITVGAAFIERFFCRFLCPMGAIFSLAAVLAPVRLKKRETNCGKCKACSSVCPGRIPLNQTETVKSGECYRCMKCTEICPRGNMQSYFGVTQVPEYVIIAVQTVVLLGLLYYFKAVRF